jgi:hypothetical protein
MLYVSFLVVIVLAIESKVRGFEPGQGWWMFKGYKKSVAQLPLEGIWSRRPHVVKFYSMLKFPTE